jgi:hypothetical protein
MKSLPKAALFVVGLMLSAQASFGQYSINWHSIDGGGGTSTGGVFSVSGTIGQPDAGRMSGGAYTLEGGFWAAAIAVQTQGAPALVIAPSGVGQASISWSPATPGWVLQEATTLAPPNWSDSASGASNPVSVPANLPTKFYRLHKQP